LRIDILTLFPEMFSGPFDHSIIKRAKEQGIVGIVIHNIRDYTHDKHRIVDDYPYGGGAGMVLKPEPIFEAVEAIKATADKEVTVALLSPQGRLFNQQMAQELSLKPHLVLICGHYEGVDERVRGNLVDEELSIGDYVLSGGEIAAMVVVDSVVRLLPGAVGSETSLKNDSHSGGLLQYPQYTRPETYRGWSVPGILLSGNHSEIVRWQHQQSLLRTFERRPDLLEKAALSEEDQVFIGALKKTRSKV